MYFTTGNAIITGMNVNVQFVQPTCNACPAVPTARDQAGALWCKSCLDAHIRRTVIKNAAQWLTAAFAAVAVEQRPKLYKALATVFHPDVEGGDEAIMKALNDVRDRMR